MPDNTQTKPTDQEQTTPTTPGGESTESEKKNPDDAAQKVADEKAYKAAHTDVNDPNVSENAVYKKSATEVSGTKATPIDNMYGTPTGSDYPGTTSKSTATGSDIASSYGKNFPLIKINGDKINENELVACEIDCTGFLPKIYLSLATTSKQWTSGSTPKEGDIINVFMQPTEAAYRSMRIDFIIKNNDTNVKAQWTTGITGEKIHFQGELYIPKWYNNAENANAYTGTSRDTLVTVAKQLNLGFFFNDEENTRDYQNWVCTSSIGKPESDEKTAEFLSTQEYSPGKSAVQYFIQHVTQHAYKNFISFYNSWIDIRYGLTFINVNKQLGEDGLDEKIDIVPFQKVLTVNTGLDPASKKTAKEQKKDAKEGKTAPQPKLLTNINGDAQSVSPFFVLKYRSYSRAREITDIIGIDKVLNYSENGSCNMDDIEFKFSIPYNETKLKNGFYMLIGPGENPAYKQGDILKSYVSNNKVVSGGQLADVMANKDEETMKQTGTNMYNSGNHNRFYKIAYEHNRINNLQLQKKVVEMTLNGLNFAIMRGEKIPALIVDHDKLNQAMRVHIEHLIQRGLSEEFSGWFIVDGIKYIWKNSYGTGMGTPWRTELKLVRREWPIPGESAFPYTSDDIRKSEIADGLDIIVDNSGESGSVKESIKPNKASKLDSQTGGDVPTDGLASFMLTLWNELLSNNAEIAGKKKTITVPKYKYEVVVEEIKTEVPGSAPAPVQTDSTTTTGSDVVSPSGTSTSQVSSSDLPKGTPSPKSDGSISAYDNIFKQYATARWDWKWLAAISYGESTFNPNATSHAGAMGLMQLMPGTAKGYKVSNAYDPEQCVRGGAAAIRDIDKFMEKYVSDPEERRWFALASYNAGADNVQKYIKAAQAAGKNPQVWINNVRDFAAPETKGYANKIMAIHAKFTGQ